jgi:predicted alpha-1,2-mannosidase
MLLWWLLLACSSEEAASPVDLLSRVDPFIGTGGAGFSQGSASPAASAPGGMVKVGPDTSGESSRMGFAHCSGYWYEDAYAVAFSHTRLHGTGVSEGGAIGFSPTTAPSVDWKVYRNQVDKSSEVASPGYYSVDLPGVATVELAASTRAAHHRYLFEGDEKWLTLDLGHTAADHDVLESWMELGTSEITGFVRMGGPFSRGYGGQPTWFVARFSTPWSEVGLWEEEQVSLATVRVEGRAVAATLRFDTDVEVRVGISAVDLEGARANLEAEIPGWDFAGVVARTEALWADALSAFEVIGGTVAEQRMFASALYHALLMPTNFTDVDGRYRGLDQAVHRAEGWTYYTDFSLWDTYRTLHPLMILAFPEIASDHARSLADMGIRRGELPIWPQGIGETYIMIGNAAEVVLAETAGKGVGGFDERRAFATAHAQATLPGATGAREDLSALLEHGFLPSDLAGGSVAKTLEYAIDDAALSMWAERLGYADLAESYAARARSYAHVFDAETGFMRPRRSDGTFDSLEETEWSDAYVEGNAWQYTFLVPQDAMGLADLFGGPEQLAEKLDEFFAMSERWVPDYAPAPYYWHGNEPDIHAAFLYGAIGQPEQTEKWARWVRETHYTDGPDGLAGNDDGGTLSSWYVFAALGLYPLNGTLDYVVSTPLFDSVRLRTSATTWLEVTGEGAGHGVESVHLDGEEWTSSVISHDRLVGASRLHTVRSR